MMIILARSSAGRTAAGHVWSELLPSAPSMEQEEQSQVLLLSPGYGPSLWLLRGCWIWDGKQRHCDCEEQGIVSMLSWNYRKSVKLDRKETWEGMNKGN